jgi:hypothetical protein
MNHYKIILETGKKRSDSRILYVRSQDIVGALNISKKIRDSSLIRIDPITYQAYMKGVDRKYESPKWDIKD